MRRFLGGLGRRFQRVERGRRRQRRRVRVLARGAPEVVRERYARVARDALDVDQAHAGQLLERVPHFVDRRVVGQGPRLEVAVRIRRFIVPRRRPVREREGAAFKGVVRADGDALDVGRRRGFLDLGDARGATRRPRHALDQGPVLDRRPAAVHGDVQERKGLVLEGRHLELGGAEARFRRAEELDGNVHAA